MSDIEGELEETPPEAFRAFLARELAADPDLERRFHSFLDTSDLDVYELRDEIVSSGAVRVVSGISVHLHQRSESERDLRTKVGDDEYRRSRCAAGYPKPSTGSPESPNA